MRRRLSGLWIVVNRPHAGDAEGAPEFGAPYRIETIGEPRLFILAPLSRRIFASRVPRVEHIR
jgi:hypothetical protein